MGLPVRLPGRLPVIPVTGSVRVPMTGSVRVSMTGSVRVVRQVIEEELPLVSLALKAKTIEVGTSKQVLREHLPLVSTGMGLGRPGSDRAEFQ